MSTKDEEISQETQTTRRTSEIPLPHLTVEQITITTESPTGENRCAKSPVTIQEWVDSIEFNKSAEDYINLRDHEEQVCPADTLHLGAEASFTEDKFKTEEKEGSENGQQNNSNMNHTEQDLNSRRQNLLQMRAQQGSLQSDVSSQSSLSSIETLLEARREDPEEILLNLGFGGSIEPLDPLARIPKRFLKPSRVKGNSLDEFVRHQEELLETLDSGFCGYRGLSGWSSKISSSFCPLCPLVYSQIGEDYNEHNANHVESCLIEVCDISEKSEETWQESSVECWCK